MPSCPKTQRPATGPTDGAITGGVLTQGTADAAGAAKRGRIAAGRERVEHQITSTYHRLEDARPSSGPIDTAFRAFERDTAAGGGVMSAAVAFRAFLFLVPYVFFCVVTFGFASEASSESPEELARSVGVTGLMARTFASVANLDTWDRVWAICISGFATYPRRPCGREGDADHPRADLAGAGAEAQELEPARRRRRWWRSSPRSCSWVAGSTGCARSRRSSRDLQPDAVGGGRVFGVWLLASRLLPHAECPWWALAPGAGLVAIGMTGLQAATVFYFAGSIERKSDTYGAIGTSLALLLWAYVLGRIITAAISLNAAFWYRSEERAGRAVPAPIDLEEQLAGRSAGAVGLTTPADRSGGSSQLTILALSRLNSASSITP